MSQPLPRMSAAQMPRELASWALAAIAMGALEGSLMGIVVKSLYAGVAPPALHNLAVAAVAAAPSFTNLASFLIAGFAHGRDKLAILHRLIQALGLCLLLMAAAPVNGGGLVMFCAATVAARVAWTGILTVRAAVWRANYQRAWRARVTGRIVQLASIVVAASAAVCGWLLEWDALGLRAAFVGAALAAFFAAANYRKVRVRRRSALLAAERAERALDVRRLSLHRLVSVLRDDRDFRNYMVGMMVLGSGNLMLIPMLVVMLSEHLSAGQSQQVLVTASIPLLMLYVTVPYWAGQLDRRHIFGYRAIQSWTYVAANVLYASAMLSGSAWLLWPAAVALGLAYAGGHLGWNLGHNDFSSDANAGHYMAVHITLTGLRGLVMPLLGVGFYQWLSWSHPAAAPAALLLPVALTIMGSLMFVYLHVRHQAGLQE